jgi:hypothetical protein
MLVVDASRLCAAFISNLSVAQSDWFTWNEESQAKMIHQANQWGLEKFYTAYWLDVQFVAHRTEVLQKMIWYPMIPLLFLVVARSPIFDDWSHPTALIATMVILVVYLISCSFLLERVAKNMRGKAIAKLGEELRILRGNSTNDPRIGRLENMIREIESLKRGAFLPVFQQPWVEAALALASGAGGLAWMGNFLGAP